MTDLSSPAETAYFVYVTAPDVETARHLAKLIIEQRLAACANILGGMESIYWWEGKATTDREAVLIFKTSGMRLADLEAKIAELHPYDCPCIVAWPLTMGHGPFLDWIQREVSGG